MMYSPMRVGGLASGIDVDQIVNDLMKAEHMKVDKLQQQKQVMEWQKEEYRDINLKLKNLYDVNFDMKLSKSYLKYEAVGAMDDGSDFEKYFTVSPGSGTINGSYDVKVEQIATSAKLESVESISKPLTGNPLNASIKIEEGNNKFDVTIDGITKEVKLPASEMGTSALAREMEIAINEAFGWKSDNEGETEEGRTEKGVKKVKVEVKDNRLTIQPADNFNKVPIILSDVGEGSLLSSLGFDSENNSYKPLDPNESLKNQIKFEGSFGGTFKINDHEITVDKSDSLNDILDRINSSEAGVKAHYDKLTDKVVLVSKETGQGANIEIADDSGLFEALGFKETSATGENARIVLNNTIVEKATNDFTVNGMRFNLNKATGGKTATFSTKNDPDAVVENIKKYIDTYNKTIFLINDKLSEKRYRDFSPLTDAQKKEMSEDDIKLWEEKAKSGLLRSDLMLDRIVNSLRSAVSDPVGSNSLSAIGITTGDWREKGILHVDEKKLREAIAKDPEAVMKLFTADGDETKSKGVVNRVYNVIKGGIRDITDKAGGGEFQKFDNSYLGKRIRDVKDRINEWEERLWKTEERYWQQFAAMEKAISAMNQQSMWLASQMGAYGG